MMSVRPWGVLVQKWHSSHFAEIQASLSRGLAIPGGQSAGHPTGLDRLLLLQRQQRQEMQCEPSFASWDCLLRISIVTLQHKKSGTLQVLLITAICVPQHQTFARSGHATLCTPVGPKSPAKIWPSAKPHEEKRNRVMLVLSHAACHAAPAQPCPRQPHQSGLIVAFSAFLTPALHAPSGTRCR